LEIGAGSGSTTVQCLETLKTLKIPFHYTFTDISNMFLSEAKKKFGNGPEMTYQLFNIENEPMHQGFMPEEFDVIIGVQVVHATISIDESLRNLKKILRVGGSLILGESLNLHAGHTFPYGMLDGWWRFKDFRLQSKMTALLDEQQWKDCLTRAQFDNISTLVTQMSSGVISSRNVTKYTPISINENTGNKWFLIGDSSSLFDGMSQAIKTQNRGVILHEDPEENLSQVCSDVFSRVDLEGVICFFTEFVSNSIHETQSQIVATVLSILKSYESNINNFKIRPNIVLITRGVYNIGDSEPGNPNGATVWGMLKVFRNENPTARVRLIDLDSKATTFEYYQVLGQIWNLNEDMFIAFRHDKTYTLRISYMEKQTLSIQLPNTDYYKFINPDSGAFADIDFVPKLRDNPEENEVELEVRACALNFRDLFMIMKPEGFDLSNPNTIGSLDSVGLDVSGVVVAVGAKAKRFQIGDEVFGMAEKGAMGSHVLVSEAKLLKIPDNMTFEEASTIPCAFMTAIISLVDVADISANDRVLIHVASGGVGLAAIQVAKSVGAEIYATAGNNRKRAYLRSLGIKYVYNSRDTGFREGITRDTNGTGVTVVLNSLTGPNFKESTLAVCSPGARFVEIAKINIWQPHEVVSLRPDVKYNIVDLSLRDDKIQELSGVSINTSELLSRIEGYIAHGKYTGLPCVTYPLSRVRDAFYHFQKAKHIGKIVLKIPRTILSDSGKIEHKHLIFNSKSSYMITGGLGGLGIEVAKWMKSTGARTIILLGRSLPSETLQTQIDAWNRNGSNVVVLQTDIGDYENCQHALETIKSLGLPPLRGIMHAAGVISDALISNQTTETFEAVFRPKVYGGWHFHQLTLDTQLEFFIMFSSLSGIFGMISQCNHSAGNRFLDSLAHYRVNMGLPATTVNWGKY